MSGIDIRDHREPGRLDALQDGERIGEIDYFVLERPAPALVAVHTVVDKAHEGQGVAAALAAELYASAAREGLAVVPLCPYVARWAARHPEQAPEAPAEVRAAARGRLDEDPSTW